VTRYLDHCGLQASRADALLQVSKIEGVFSGTLSYIFNEFSTGKSEGPAFSSVVKIAREKGYTVCNAHHSPLYPRLMPLIRNLTPETI
jgi:hypothetical protein